MAGEMDSPAQTSSSPKLTRLPWLLALGLLVITACPRVYGHDHLRWAMIGVSAGLIAWFVVLWVTGRRMDVVAIRCTPVGTTSKNISQCPEQDTRITKAS